MEDTSGLQTTATAEVQQPRKKRLTRRPPKIGYYASKSKNVIIWQKAVKAPPPDYVANYFSADQSMLQKAGFTFPLARPDGSIFPGSKSAAFVTYTRKSATDAVCKILSKGKTTAAAAESGNCCGGGDNGESDPSKWDIGVSIKYSFHPGFADAAKWCATLFNPYEKCYPTDVHAQRCVSDNPEDPTAAFPFRSIQRVSQPGSGNGHLWNRQYKSDDGSETVTGNIVNISDTIGWAAGGAIRIFFVRRQLGIASVEPKDIEKAAAEKERKSIVLQNGDIILIKACLFERFSIRIVREKTNKDDSGSGDDNHHYPLFVAYWHDKYAAREKAILSAKKVLPGGIIPESTLRHIEKQLFPTEPKKKKAERKEETSHCTKPEQPPQPMDCSEGGGDVLLPPLPNLEEQGTPPKSKLQLMLDNLITKRKLAAKQVNLARIENENCHQNTMLLPPQDCAKTPLPPRAKSAVALKNSAAAVRGKRKRKRQISSFGCKNEYNSSIAKKKIKCDS